MNQSQAARLLQEAVGLQRHNRLDEAAALCERIVARFPRVSEPLQLLGLIRLQQRRLDEAEHFLRESASLAPGRAEFQSSLGNVLAARGKTPEAEFVYTEALQLDPGFRPARLGLARLYNRVGLYHAAEEEARILLAGAADDSKALSVLGLALEGQGRLGEAEKAFRQALRQRPGYGVVHHNLGRLLASLHRRYEALEQFDAAIAAGVRGPRIGTHRARALLNLDRHDEAIATLEHIVSEHQGATDAHSLLARVRRAAGDSDFDRDFAAAAREHTTNVALQRAYARLLCANGDPSVAADVLHAALRGGGSRAALQAALAGVYMELGQYENALEAAREACRADPADPTLRDGVFQALLALGRGDEAGDLIAAARRRAPDDTRYEAWAATHGAAFGASATRRGELLERVESVDLPVADGFGSAREFHAELAGLLDARHGYAIPPLDNRLTDGTRVAMRPEAENNDVVRALHTSLLAATQAIYARLGTVPAVSRLIESVRLEARGALRPASGRIATRVPSVRRLSSGGIA